MYISIDDRHALVIAEKRIPLSYHLFLYKIIPAVMFSLADK